MRAIADELSARGWLGWDRADSPAVDWADILRVHPERYARGVEELCAGGGGAIDADTIVSPGSWEAALHSAGGAVALVDALLDGSVPTGLSAHRPPGHHAETARGMGFCLLANAAIAARHAIEARGVDRVMIVDWDVHHGNGTEQVFLEDPTVLTCSMHEWPLYPGTGPASERGRGAGEGFNLNLPMPGGSGDAAWRAVMEHVVVERGRGFDPGLILICAGFDAHADDPLATCRVSEEGFAGMARSVRRLGAELGVPVGAVLEGGYALGALARSVAAVMEVLGGPAPGPEDVSMHPLVDSALSA